MKDKSKRLWWHDRLSIGLLIGMLLMAVLAQGKPEHGLVFLMLAIVLLIVFAGVELFMNRCPHCDRFLGRDRGLFCPHCGERIREAREDT